MDINSPCNKPRRCFSLPLSLSVKHQPLSPISFTRAVFTVAFISALSLSLKGNKRYVFVCLCSVSICAVWVCFAVYGSESVSWVVSSRESYGWHFNPFCYLWLAIVNCLVEKEINLSFHVNWLRISKPCNFHAIGLPSIFCSSYSCKDWWDLCIYWLFK